MKLTIDDFKVGDECIITSKPDYWTSLCNDNNPFYKNLTYPYKITIKDKRTDSYHTGIACENYGWDLGVLIKNNLIQKINMKIDDRFPFKLDKDKVKQIIDIACAEWKKKLSIKWASILFENHVLVDEKFYKKMRKFCTNTQNLVFDDIFSKDNFKVDFSILNNEDVFFIQHDNYTYLFKGSNPCEKKVKRI